MQTFGFFNSKNGDRKYTAEEMSHYFEGLVGNGILENCGHKLQVLHTEGMGIKVQSGRAFLDCHWYNNSADVLMELPQSEITYDRIDSVILRMDTAEEVRNITLLIRKGTPAESPVAPSLENTESVKELCLADIRINKLVETISQANITDTRTSGKCGFVTGLIKQVDTSTLFLQWQTAYSEYYKLSTTDFENWKKNQEDGFVIWSNNEKKTFSEWKKAVEEEFNKWKTTNEKSFVDWFEGIKDKLSGDIATKLTTEIEQIKTELDKKFSVYIGETLPELSNRDEKTLYFKITDTISTATSENIKVSPKMGIKLI